MKYSLLIFCYSVIPLVLEIFRQELFSVVHVITDLIHHDTRTNIGRKDTYICSCCSNSITKGFLYPFSSTLIISLLASPPKRHLPVLAPFFFFFNNTHSNSSQDRDRGKCLIQISSLKICMLSLSHSFSIHHPCYIYIHNYKCSWHCFYQTETAKLRPNYTGKSEECLTASHDHNILCPS